LTLLEQEPGNDNSVGHLSRNYNPSVAPSSISVKTIHSTTGEVVNSQEVKEEVKK